VRTIRRTVVLPPTLRATGIGGIRTAELIAGYPGSKEFKFDDYWNRADVRGALYASQGGVCAYCGCELQRGNRGDVDHFRPKDRIADDRHHTGYWWLTYEFTNYFLSCRTCNSTYKRNKFPLAEGAERVRFETRELLADEARVLLDPCVDKLDELVRVDLSRALFPVEPKPGLSDSMLTRVKATIAFFGINDQPELTKARMSVVKKVAKALESGQPERVRNLAIRYRPNSFVVRYMLERNAPAALPTPAQELEWLMRDMLRTLRLILQHRLAHDSDRLRKDQDELFWSFAFLLADPPGGLLGVQPFLAKHKIESGVIEKHLEP
jgi:uncharacterized protein (TIGR02646 family)